MPEFPPEVYALIDAAIAEDQTFNDPTTAAVVPAEIRGVGMLRAKAHGVLAGVEVGLAVFRRVEPALELEALLSDGAALSPGDDIARVEGPAAGILRAERIALNFMQRMSGIASATNRYVRAIDGTPSRIVDTRKTAPGHRYLDKYAVRAGGGDNHRTGLSDWVMFKDNHLAVISIPDGVAAARQRWPGRIVYVECDRIQQVDDALAAGADALLLDNMAPAEVRACVARAAGHHCLLEVSGGITLETVAEYAATGVDFISVGRLTNSAPALDIALDVKEAPDPSEEG